MLTSLQKMTMLGSKFTLHAPSSCPVQPWWVILVNTMPVNYKLKQLKSGNPHECSEKVCVHIWNLCPERTFLYLYYYCTLHFKYTFRHSCGKHLIQWQQCIFRASSIHYVWCHSVFILPSFRLLWEHVLCNSVALHIPFFICSHTFLYFFRFWVGVLCEAGKGIRRNGSLFNPWERGESFFYAGYSNERTVISHVGKYTCAHTHTRTHSVMGTCIY